MKTNNQSVNAGSVVGTPLKWLRLEGAFVFILSILLYAHSSASWWLFAILLLAPDLAMAGYWLGARWGAVLYNTAHSYVGPVALVSLSIALLHDGLLCYALIWSAHVGLDRALGYGLEYPDAFRNTHLGWLGARTQA
jgi:hypothetical protein